MKYTMADLPTPALGELCFFTGLSTRPVIAAFHNFVRCLQAGSADLSATYFTLKAELIAASFAHEKETAYGETLWQDAVMRAVLEDENPLTLRLEKGELADNHPFAASIDKELIILAALYNFPWQEFCRTSGLDSGDVFWAKVYEPGSTIVPLLTAFTRGGGSDLLTALSAYIAAQGLGLFGRHRSFKLGQNGSLLPVVGQRYKKMDDLVGYERQKKAILDNTAAFVRHYGGLNVLLQGDMGTGKSTMVKALLNSFGAEKLKLIEIKKDQLAFIPAIIKEIAGRPYAFILFIDDLSFEDNDPSYKVFKNVLEGSLEENPKNLRIYATSNKRHLITETRSERDNAIHTKDVLEEKLSLSSRFGLVINFTAPDQNDYLAIVDALAARDEITLSPEEVKGLAIQWELRHLNRSGRTAEQFIEHLKTQALAED